MPLATPSTSPAPEPKKGRSWAQLSTRARTIASIAVLFVALIAVGAVGGYFYFRTHQPATPTKKTTIETLSQDELNKLSEVGANLGTANQTLNIGANALFRGKVDVGSDLSVNGRLNANGPVVLSQLNITGSSAVAGLNVGSNLTVGGTTTLQKSLTVGDLLTVTGGLNVSGATSVNALNANSIAVRSLSITGPLTIAHLVTQGTTPSGSAGTAVGAGGTMSVSGNDTAGTVNINTGGAPPAGVLATIVFRAAYSNGVHVLLSPLTGASASLPAYVTRNSTGFQIKVDTPPAAGTVYAFDYFVTQ